MNKLKTVHVSMPSLAQIDLTLRIIPCAFWKKKNSKLTRVPVADDEDVSHQGLVLLKSLVLASYCVLAIPAPSSQHSHPKLCRRGQVWPDS